MEEKTGQTHRLVLEDRGKGRLTGILDVISFDENTVVLDTELGRLTIRGKDLHICRLTLEKGEVDLEGQCDSLVYASGGASKRKGQPLFTRLFQ